jgi:hypothetical protein
LLPLHKSKEVREAADRSFIAKPRKSGKRQTKKSSKKNQKGCIAKSATEIDCCKSIECFFPLQSKQEFSGLKELQDPSKREKEKSL